MIMRKYLKIAKLAQKKKKHSKAILYYKKYLKINKNDADAWYDIGYNYYYSSRISEALQSFKSAIMIKRTDPNTWHYLGHCYQLQENYRKSITCFRNELRIDPSDDHSWNELGYCIFAQAKTKTQIKKAIKCYDRALRINSKNSDALANKGTAVYNLDKPNRAADLYAKALQINPKDPYALHYSGHCLQELNQYKKSICNFQKQLQIKEDEYEDTLYQIGLCYLFLIKLEDAQKYFVRFLRKHRNDIDALISLALTYNLLEKHTKSFECLRKIFKIKRAANYEQIKKDDRKQHSIGLKFYNKYSGYIELSSKRH